MRTAEIFMAFYFCIAVGTICMIAMLIQKPDRIPCDVVEISPDVSIQDKEYCRQLRHRQAIMKHNL